MGKERISKSKMIVVRESGDERGGDRSDDDGRWVAVRKEKEIESVDE